ncbi:DUF4412 domain-containing protein [Heliobacterium undosum]|uniref:DUF4412 domain-containing protein n=1 Tax=Heliomicrobium undosum TaxID=121734 RepID=A0A845L423_9FIRM|nr:DUF4412 domain-containing protein [Heliomicrobium undosum]MZP31392.1 DUF4412 domain-containing protein [Heliomicrobium undosum]
MRKILLALIGLSMFAGLLAGCGGGQQTSAAPGVSAPQQTKAAQQAEEKAPAATNDVKSLLAKTKDIKTLSFTMVTLVDGKEIGKAKMWQKEPKFKMEFTDGAEKGIMLMDQAQKVAYMYLPSENMAMKIDMTQAESKAKKSPLEYDDELTDDSKYKVLGDETIRGEDCKVIEVQEKDGTAKLWLSKKSGLPLRAEAKSATETSTVDFLDYKTDNIADSEFELPSGVQVMDMNQITAGMPKGQ